MIFDKRILLVMASVGVLAMCGGKAVLDSDESTNPSGGSTGGAGAGGDARGGFGMGAAAGQGPVTTTGPIGDVCLDDAGMGTTANDCQAACEILYCCAERECAGVQGGDKDGFVADCVESCTDQPALMAVVNGADCVATVATVAAVSADFADTCNGAP